MCFPHNSRRQREHTPPYTGSKTALHSSHTPNMLDGRSILIIATVESSLDA